MRIYEDLKKLKRNFQIKVRSGSINAVRLVLTIVARVLRIFLSSRGFDYVLVLATRTFSSDFLTILMFKTSKIIGSEIILGYAMPKGREHVGS